MTQGRRGVEEQGTRSGHNAVDHSDIAHTRTVADLCAYDIRRGGEGNELCVRSAGNRVGRAPAVFHLERLADDTFLNVHDLVVLLVGEIAGREQLLHVIELTAVLCRNVLVGRIQEGLTGAFGRRDDRRQGRYGQNAKGEATLGIGVEHLGGAVRISIEDSEAYKSSVSCDKSLSQGLELWLLYKKTNSLTRMQGTELASRMNLAYLSSRGIPKACMRKCFPFAGLWGI